MRNGMVSLGSTVKKAVIIEFVESMIKANATFALNATNTISSTFF